MSIQTLWLTDDCCPRCGELLRERTAASGCLIHECACGWSVTWDATTAGGGR